MFLLKPGFIKLIKLASCLFSGRTDSDIGYVYRRLLDNVPTGIFECNSGCKCKSSCLNRVAQVRKIQVFLVWSAFEHP